MTKAEAISILDTNRDYYVREVRAKCRMLAIENHPGKWSERCYFAKGCDMEVLKGTANDFDFLKSCSCYVINHVESNDEKGRVE